MKLLAYIFRNEKPTPPLRCETKEEYLLRNSFKTFRINIRTPKRDQVLNDAWRIYKAKETLNEINRKYNGNSSKDTKKR